MSLGDWIGGLFGSARGTQSSERVHAAVERIVEVVNPRLKLVHRYGKRLAPAVETSLGYVDGIVAAIPPAREASAAAWSTDSYLQAFFARGDEIARAFSRSAAVRTYFDAHPEASHGFAVLGMEMVERKILGMGLEGDQVRSDVEQTTVSFGDWRVRVCTAAEAELRATLGSLLVDQMAIEGLGRAATDQDRRSELEKERALLKTRLKLLERQGAGARAALGGEPVDASAQARIAAQLEENTQELGRIPGGPQLLEGELERVREVLADPAQYLHVSARRLRMDRMNVVAGSAVQDAREFEFQVARVPGNPPLTRAFTFARFARTDLLPAGQALDEAARLLA